MASIERTAYPILSKNPSNFELEELYSFTEEELDFLFKNFRTSRIKKNNLLLAKATLLKVYQRLGYFPDLDKVPKSIIQHIKIKLDINFAKPEIGSSALYDYKTKIRKYTGIKPFKEKMLKNLEKFIYNSARVKDDPVDIINTAIAEIIKKKYELPAFSTINGIAIRIRTKINHEFFNKVNQGLTKKDKEKIDNLLKPLENSDRTYYNQLKELPKRATLTHLKVWLSHLNWLENLGDIYQYLSDIPLKKILSFADEANVLDAGEMKDLRKPKRYTLILSLIYKMQLKTRDNLIAMFSKKIYTIRNNAKEKLEQIHQINRQLNEELIDTFNNVFNVFNDSKNNEDIVNKSNTLFRSRGGLDKLIENCTVVNAYKNNNYLPLLWSCFVSYRSIFFKIINAVTIQSSSEDKSLEKAVEYLKEIQTKKSKIISADVKINFVTENWRKLIVVKKENKTFYNRKNFEVCIFSYLVDELKSGDIFVEGTENYSDYRKQLSIWKECELVLDEYCQEIEIPNNSINFVSVLKKILEDLTKKVDDNFLENEQLVIENDKPKLKRGKREKPSQESQNQAQKLYNMLPERNLMDIICNNQHWVNFSRHFNPPSGSDPKIKNPFLSYILTTFAYGCNIGPLQMSRHIKHEISSHTLSYVNNKHINSDKLDKANVDILNAYNKFDLPKNWGDGKRAAADGTKIDIYEQNLLAEYHIRYGGYGGIAYHHVADNYVALFSHFIPCGIREAVYIIDGIIKKQIRNTT